MLLIRVSDAIGFLSTFALVVVTALIGSYLWRTQGRQTMLDARAKLAQGQFPSSEIIQGLLIGAGGLLLLTPGFATDIFGFLCLLPLTRRWLASRFKARASGFMGSAAGSMQFQHRSTGGANNDFKETHSQAHPSAFESTKPGSAAKGRVIEGEVVEDTQ